MRTLKTLTATGLVVAWLLTPVTAFAQVTAADFLPVVQGGPRDVKQPDQVAIKGKTVTAASAQDAVNAATQKNVDELASGGSDEVGARMVQFPSGVGYVATGAAAYRTMENPTATRIAKRKAYVIAFTKAKKNLAEMLGGLTNEGKETIRESLVNINLPKEEMTNISTQSEEALRQAVEMMLRGFVIYEVKDDTAQNTVYVTIVTTPKTRGKHARPAPNVVEASDLRDGLNQVIAEVRSGLVPPVGGRIITMRSTGETAFVGFGSAVVRSSKNNAVQLKLNLDPDDHIVSQVTRPLTLKDKFQRGNPITLVGVLPFQRGLLDGFATNFEGKVCFLGPLMWWVDPGALASPSHCYCVALSIEESVTLDIGQLKHVTKCAASIERVKEE